jgi:hypothetical protein
MLSAQKAIQRLDRANKIYQYHEPEKINISAFWGREFCCGFVIEIENSDRML